MADNTNYELPDYSTAVILGTKHGDIRVLKADFDKIDALVVEWESKNPTPVPPTKSVTPDGESWTLKMARQAKEISRVRGIGMEQAELVVAAEQDEAPDESDETYQQDSTRWGWLRYAEIERELLLNHVLYDVGDGRYWTLFHIVHADRGGNLTERYLGSPTLSILRGLLDSEDRLSLYQFVLSISKLTWDAVLESADSLGVTWQGKTVLRKIPSGGGDPQDIVGIAKITAIETGMTPSQFDDLEVSQQAELLAVALTRQWLERFQIEKARAERS